MPSVLRILDANTNRAREALRVMEEAARFCLDDADLNRRLKALRHDLAAALEPLPLTPNRDAPGDVGAAIKTPRESARGSLADVALAAGKRLSEALRSIEEYAKLLPGDLARAIEKLRYRGYDLEQRLTLALATGCARQWRLCVLLTQSLCPDGDWQRVARAAVRGGADCLQLREKHLDASELLGRARWLVRTLGRDAAIIVNDRPDVALLSGAHGVHLGQTDLPCREARRLVGRQLLIGVSTSRLSQARQALRDGADYCGVGPMFPTTTKHKDQIVGPRYLARYLRWNRLPHLAIAGITPENVGQLTDVRGIAVSSAVCSAKNPLTATRSLLRAMGRQCYTH